MKRFSNARWAMIFASLAVGLLLFLRNTGVREVRQPVDSKEQPLSAATPAPDDWPWWRGSGRNNSIASVTTPLNWSISDNVEWKASIPGRGHSSPCLWDSKIFLTTSDPDEKTIALICLSKETGKTLWQTELHRGGFPEIHKKNSYASSSPACDGKFVFNVSVINNALHVSAIDFAGRIEWQSEAGPYSSEWGYGSSPVIHDSLVIVSADNRGNPVDRLMGTSWLAALHRKTGKIVWRIKRREGDSFGSPTVARIADRDQLLLAGKEWVSSYNPLSGDELWKFRWNAKRTANTLTFDDQNVFASTRQPQGETICIRADGHGDVTDTQLVWRDTKTSCDVPSPTVHDGRFYCASDDGVLTCLNSTDGKAVWKKRLGGNISSSPIIINDQLYCCNEEGTTFAIPLKQRGEVVAENVLDEGILASPIVSGNRLFIRTLSNLYCLSAPQITPIANGPEDANKRL